MRQFTGSSSVMAFTNAFHRRSLGSLAVSGSASTRELGGVARHDIIRVPYDGYPSRAFDSASYIDYVMGDPGSGIKSPPQSFWRRSRQKAGMNTESAAWLTEIQHICRKHGALLSSTTFKLPDERAISYLSSQKSNLTLCAFRNP